MNHATREPDASHLHGVSGACAADVDRLLRPLPRSSEPRNSDRIDPRRYDERRGPNDHNNYRSLNYDRAPDRKNDYNYRPNYNRNDNWYRGGNGNNHRRRNEDINYTNRRNDEDRRNNYGDSRSRSYEGTVKNHRGDNNNSRLCENCMATLEDIRERDDKIKQEFEWKEEQQLAFDKLREALCSEPVLMAPDMTKEFIVTIDVDASDFALGAILGQGEIGKDHACI